MQKNTVCRGVVASLGSEGEGVVNLNGGRVFVPGCLPADVQETDVPDPDIAALLEQEDLPETLPVWEQTDAEPALLGEYDTVPVADALALAGLPRSDTQPRLVYLAGGGYIQPAWKLESQGETVYLSALGG